MHPFQVRSFMEKYLRYTGCEILEADANKMIVQLSIEADKDIMNRPYYWRYVENLNLEPDPVEICFCFGDHDEQIPMRKESLFQGSNMFTRILNSAINNGKFAKLYESPNYVENGSIQEYQLWLAVNFRLSYVCDLKKDKIFYLGINLNTGEIEDNFYSTLQHIPWTRQLPINHRIEPANLTISEAIGALEEYIQMKLDKEDSSWASNALEKMKAEIAQLDTYYTDGYSEEKQLRIDEIVKQYNPKIEVSPINAGIFHIR